MFTSWSLIWLLATVLLVVGGALNLSQRANHALPPTDGVVWIQQPNGIFAEQIEPNSAGARAGIFKGDRLIGISLDEKNFDEVTSPADVQMFLETAGVGGSLTYSVERTSYSFSDRLYFADITRIETVTRWNASIFFLLFVGTVWLGVGIFVLFKQGGHAPFILHFATLCLSAFVFHAYRPLGLGEDFDLAINILDVSFFVFFVPIFLHFCLRYPVRSEVFAEQKWKTIALYAPAAILTLAYAFFSLVTEIPVSESFKTSINSFADAYEIFPTLDRLQLIHFVGGISLGAGALLWRFFKTRQPLVRQRLKWAVWGTIIAVLPILGFQIAKRFIYLPADDVYSAAVTTLPLALIPLSFGHSVVRYRLMDVDVVVRRALVYAMTTLTIAAMIGAVALGLVYLAIGENLSTTEITLRALIAIVAMAGIVMLSEPLKNFLQERADRFFYGERYDLRRGLLDFGRTLSATTALEPLLNALVSRLQQVLDVEKVAVFIEDEDAANGYRIARAVNLDPHFTVQADFRQMIRAKSAQKGIVRADELDLETETSDPQNFVRQELHYYAPCVVRGRMVAVIGLGRAGDGSLLSSEDLDILHTVSGYVAVAIENSLLYQEQEKRAAELALLKEFNESIVESVNVGLLAVDESGKITRCNSTFEEMLGLSREETVGKFVEEIFDENFAGNLMQILGKSRWHLQEIRHAYKLQTTGADGKNLILNVAFAPLRSVSNELTGGILVLENVTNRVKFEEQLQQNEKLSSIGLLAAGVAHEVNTPLTGVSSYTQMLLQMIPETDPKHALLKKVQKQTERATNIAGNLLNFSRAGNGSTEFSEIDVNKTLDDTLQLLEPQLRKSRVEVIKQYAEKPPRIIGNAGKLQQVFTNLILNARDAMFDGGTITLTTESNENGSVLIKVSDTGIGIEEENLGKIYDPFFTTKAVGSGTGLGLAVTYGIVQEHSGTISVSSEVGSGTTFELSFPAAQNFEQQRKAS